ncbi:MAG: HAMP domain-containing histidine kinase [Marinifilaceae bacterium]|nr:HAMP domain-containing histidine kinase [Marinifilaceae bacterium]
MDKIKKKALLFCIDTTERKILSSVMHAFSLEVIEEKFVDKVLNIVKEQGIDYVLINENKEQLFGIRSLLKKQSNCGTKFVLFRKNLIHLHLKIFNEDDNYMNLKIELVDSVFDQSRMLSFRDQNCSENLNRNLLSCLSHEIFTPLNSVIGFSQLLQEINYSEAEVKNFSGYIFKSGKEMQKKCLALLDLIALRTGAINLNYSHLSIVSLFSEILEKYKFQKKSVFINIDYDYDLQDVEVYTDKSKIERILERLLDNALKFTEKGKINFGFTIKKNTSMILFVKDTGIGISEKHIKYVFEPFWQVDSSNSRKYGGLGLGLHLVKEFVDLLNGKIVLDSEEGKGTCIQIEIPLPESIQSEKVRLEEACSLK